MREPLISVVVPVYNTEKYLRRCVESIRAQNYKNLEIILVDDGSSDGSYVLMQKLAAEDPGTKIFTEENGGASKARNTGVRNATGEFVSFIDSDDYIEPEMIESLVSATDKYQADSVIAQCGRREQDEAGNPLPNALPEQKELKIVESVDFIESLLLYTGESSLCTKLVSRKLLLEHPFAEGVMCEDFLLCIQLAMEVKGILQIPMVGYNVVHRAGSATRRANANQFSKAYVDIIKHSDYVEKDLVPVMSEKSATFAQSARRFGLYQRMDYMLHVPIADMNADNDFYDSVCRYLKGHYADTLRNPGLTLKNRLYLTLFTICPKFTRKVHAAIRL